MIPTFAALLGAAKDFGDILDRVRNKLLSNPTEASVKLAEVLGELTLILEFVERETVHYLEIVFLPDRSNFVQCRSALLSLESGYVTIKGYEARGHCHRMQNIFEKYLDRWFSRVLDPGDAQSMRDLFQRMSLVDDQMIQGIEEITRWLKNESEAILVMVDADQLDAANVQIKNARLAVQQTRRNVVEALARLKLLQASFVASSQTV